MPRTTPLFATLAAFAAIGLAGCDVEQTREGNVTVPKVDVDVDKKQAGDVTLPKYDVTTPDIDVNKKQATVTVPDVDIKTAEEKKAEEQTKKQ